MTDKTAASQCFLEGFLSYLARLRSHGELSEVGYQVLADRAIALTKEAIALQKIEALVQPYEERFAALMISSGL
jgi:hypothetical protein